MMKCSQNNYNQFMAQSFSLNGQAKLSQENAKTTMIKIYSLPTKLYRTLVLPKPCQPYCQTPKKLILEKNQHNLNNLLKNQIVKQEDWLFPTQRKQKKSIIVFSRPEPFIFTKEKRHAKESDDVYHFVSFVPFKGKVYELDGLQQGPILLGSYQNNDWLPIAKTHINERIQKYSQTEVRFNLMAVIEDKKIIAEQQTDQAQRQKFYIYSQMKEKAQQLDQSQQQDFTELSKKFNPEDLKNAMHIEIPDFQQKLLELNGTIQIQKSIIDDENLKLENYRKENIRRKHNYIPFILELLKLASKKGQLSDLITKAKKIEEEKENKEKERKQQQQKKKEEEKPKEQDQPKPQ
eukprot:TRINITY_DN4805_c0_g1_i1.p1 TRINITY_DN4805_c0_g1~~TRINITY_DN4805_c0_g1_i1.p1  ORF type:complete len:348 (-),score=69.32 TRINITY_DN4805_c0_g1_i1:262-1305(-)